MSVLPFAAERCNLSICNQQPLGGEIVARPTLLGQSALEPAGAGGLDEIRRQLQLIADSNHPDDKVVIEEMNGNFWEHDAPYLTGSLKAAADVKIVDWILGASQTDLSSFLEWNVARQKQLQTRLELDLPDLKEQAIVGLDRVVDYGLLPAAARKLTRDALQRTRFIALDSFEAGRVICAGYYTIGKFIMGLANQYFDGADGLEISSSFLTHAFVHESGHARDELGGGSLRQILDKAIDCAWFNEALNDHHATVARHGEPLLVSPSLRTKPGPVYTQVRELAGLVLTCGYIPLDLVGEACVEPYLSSPNARGTARLELDARLRRGFEGTIDTGEDNIVEYIAREYNTFPCSQATTVIEKHIKTLQEATGVWSDNELPANTPCISVTDVA